MLSRLRLAGSLGVRSSRLLQAAKPSAPALTRFCQSQVQQKKEDEVPEFGQFWRDVKANMMAKTGETGQLMFFGGLAAYLLSNEILIIHEETYIAAVMGGTFYWLMKKAGGPIAEMLDNTSQEILDAFNVGRNASIKHLQDAIDNEKHLEHMLSCRTDIIEMMRENNVMGMELEYRNNVHHVVKEVKKRLDYQVEMETFHRKVEQAHIIDWVEKEVIKSITPQQEKESISQCIRDLKAMAV
ncbi:predicted protein [Nematostella vectensis]|uniref:ATP synthase subunit b n=1 Tax=Nematostella vectensis TaxID=45351 RepID=A7RXX3_NEMVE|nr:ATP synthase F(0) complex subunit B1, mitochondrial [Nematostella vectensis]EDO43737.1 predicted protein [Nematostella vectensis]|eukprot:XP_001635800.1 predicted protein [Nematostella vectensis]